MFLICKLYIKNITWTSSKFYVILFTDNTTLSVENSEVSINIVYFSINYLQI